MRPRSASGAFSTCVQERWAPTMVALFGEGPMRRPFEVPLAVSRYRFTLAPKGTLRFPPAHRGGVATALRGALGWGLKGLLCPDVRWACPECPLKERCIYPMVFTHRPSSAIPKLSKNMDLPRPFLLRPLDPGRLEYASDEPFVFDLYALGKAAEAFPFFLITWREVGVSGLGIGRCRFEVRQVHFIDSEGRDCGLAYDGSENLVYNVPCPPYEPPPCPRSETVTLLFKTPVTLKSAGGIRREPRFSEIVRRLRDRLSSLIQFYSDRELGWDFKWIAEMAEEVEEVDSAWWWQPAARRAGRSRALHDLGGAVGFVTVRGRALEPLWPLLWMGQFVGVGKHVVFGNGWYEVKRVG